MSPARPLAACLRCRQFETAGALASTGLGRKPGHLPPDCYLPTGEEASLRRQHYEQHYDGFGPGLSANSSSFFLT